jgi:hypothetical protein
MPMPTEDDYKRVQKKQEDALAGLVDTVLRERQDRPGLDTASLSSRPLELGTGQGHDTRLQMQ